MAQTEREVTAGLPDSEAQRRLGSQGPNELPSARPRSLAGQFVDVLREPMLSLLVAAGVVNFFLAEPLDGGLLMATVLVVVGTSLYQQHKTESALAALRDLSAPRALVIRDGQHRRIPGREVVVGDLVVLAEGDRVPADGVVVDATNVVIDESTLSGESVPVRKRRRTDDDPTAMGSPGGDDTPWLFSGTLVVGGRGHLQVLGTGVGTELGRIGQSLRDIGTEDTPLQREIRRLVRFMAVVGAAVAVAVVVLYAMTRGGWLPGVLAGIAVAMSMLPEEFPVVLTVFLALGSWRMSQRHVLARRPAAVEALGSITVLCVDKTGTLTMNHMSVASISNGTQTWTVDGQPLPEMLREVAATAVLASPAASVDPTDRAFLELAEQRAELELAADEVLREYPLTPDRWVVTHVWSRPDTGSSIVAAKGAPEAVLTLCGVPDEQRSAHLQGIQQATERGERVLGVAAATWPADTPLPDDVSRFDFQFLGWVGLHDPVRPGAREAVDRCRQAGVRTVMITGDAPGTAAAVAGQLGIETQAGHLTGVDLEALSDEQLSDRVLDIGVFARVTPHQKLRLVRALQQQGEIVAMTGDGVNDAPALRAADVGVAMGQRGTDVAREAAAIVVTDDHIVSIADGIEQGRGIFDNLRKAMAYIVSVHVTIVGLALLPLAVTDWPLVLLPLQIALLELIIDPACSVVFQAEQHDPQVMQRPPRPPGAPILGRSAFSISALQGVSVLAAVFVVYLAAVVGDRSPEVVRSVTFTALALSNLSLILVNRSWRLSALAALRQRRNGALPWILGGTVAGLTVLMTVPPARHALGFGALTVADVVAAVAAALAGVTWFEVYKWVRGRRVGGA